MSHPTFLVSLQKRTAHAWRGLRLAFRTERSFRIETLAAFCVLAVLLILPLRALERVALLLATAAVLVLELLNSTMERMADLLKPRLDQYVADVKDIMAGAVLLASVAAAIVGALILWPYVTTILAHV